MCNMYVRVAAVLAAFLLARRDAETSHEVDGNAFSTFGKPAMTFGVRRASREAILEQASNSTPRTVQSGSMSI